MRRMITSKPFQNDFLLSPAYRFVSDRLYAEGMEKMKSKEMVSEHLFHYFDNLCLDEKTR